MAFGELGVKPTLEHAGAIDCDRTYKTECRFEDFFDII